MEFIRPMVEERFARMEEFGEDWDDKPVRRSSSLSASVVVNAELQNDMLMWLMSEAKGVERSLGGLARRLLLVNFAGIHNTSNVSHTGSLYKPQLRVHVGVYDCIIPSSFQPGIYRTPPPGGRECGSRGRVDQGRDGQNAQNG